MEDGVPYAIDFMNPAPDADVNSVGQENFEWVVNAVAEMAVKKGFERGQIRRRSCGGRRSYRAGQPSAATEKEQYGNEEASAVGWRN